MEAHLVSVLLAASAFQSLGGPEHLKPIRPVLRLDRIQQDAALAEVNSARSKRGLPPFAYDAGLTLAAQRCAQLRASHCIAGHLPNDFEQLPPGVTAKSAGCGALEPSWGWGACCTYDTACTQAGAAIAPGRDGRRYMHLFVR